MLAAASLLLLAATRALSACNGHQALCDRPYSNITFIGTHNSAFVGDTPFHNQFVTLTEQLNSGVRFLQAQTHDDNGQIELCHTFCWELDVGPLTNYLAELAVWMDSHPNEVVTLLLTNIDAIAVPRFDDAFAATGLRKYVLHQRSNLARDQWPTLQQMLNAGTRLVVFMDYHSDQSKVDYIMDEFSYYWETPFGWTDKNFATCAVDRPPKGDTSKLMGIMNHMLNHRIGDIVFPDMFSAASTNSLASIQKQVNLCKSQGKPQPSVIFLDWVNIGEAQKAQLVLNSLK
ncbi:hypothetical protein CDD81_7128 [Ophiocordyceps australis]|uniref:Phosphatidylinositol-specific phospholipase C X domain-containing protein n=1 Tax=Ophiocordyceps australis TaxID=1399860 RepID=A0A2C5Y6I3_9HYPO|nr:hypothetical protein CDD81_7128 [Ophiocordyceps australis]